MSRKSFSETLKKIRIRSGLKQATVAKKLFISRSTYNKYEAGERIPPVEVLVRICILFNLHPMDLFLTLIPEETKQNNPEYFKKITENQGCLTTDEIRLLSHFKELQADEKKLIVNLLKMMQAAHT